MRSDIKPLYTAYTILLSLGIIFTVVLMYDRYILPEGDPSFCAFGGDFDCGKVAQSPYASMDGFLYALNYAFDWNLPYPIVELPNPVVLFVGFFIWLYVVHRIANKKKAFGVSWQLAWKIVLGTYIFGTIFAAYLLFTSKFVIHYLCIFCLMLDVVMVATFILFALIVRKLYVVRADGVKKY